MTNPHAVLLPPPHPPQTAGDLQQHPVKQCGRGRGRRRPVLGASQRHDCPVQVGHKLAVLRALLVAHRATSHFKPFPPLLFAGASNARLDAASKPHPMHLLNASAPSCLRSDAATPNTTTYLLTKEMYAKRDWAKEQGPKLRPCAEWTVGDAPPSLLVVIGSAP